MGVILEIRADIYAAQQVLERVRVLKVVDLTQAAGTIDVGRCLVYLPVDIISLVINGPTGIFRAIVDPVFGIQLDKMVDLEIGIDTLNDIDLIIKTLGIFLLVEG